ncbi:MAG TPA: outer membrane beta-barrel protein [Terriglobales bacterium]
MKRFALLFVCLIAFALPALAQHGTEGYFGFAHETGVVGKNGFNLSGAYQLAPNFAAEADFGGYYGTHDNSGNSDNTHTFVFGPKIYKTHKRSHMTPFGHLLFGFAHNHDGNRTPDQGATSFAFMLGGGGDYNMTPKLSFRLKADLVHTHFFHEGQSNLRVGLGLAYHFGAK